ncbi:thioredoxin TrxC [Vibrio sp. 10N.261.55.A7]|uniref:thioredoxin TrxC n=1 Tax=Vibrio sp. 10N.261.55.A7 TaxID=1880851 RepID=UPI000C85E757|nr:thioredoxin TrxC [Vibrio sp. 10N.261.55.A7]PMJ89840.1 thioredoxin TrxC [Vibrio sp. 10N.261.55.A7]
MSTFTTRCPSCEGLNKIPTDRVSESPNCGKCQTSLLDGSPIEGTQSNIQALLNSEQPVVIDFWAPWCNPCVGFAPVFSQVAEEKKGSVRFIKINTENEQELAAQYRIRSIPTVMVFKGGKSVDMINGALPKGQFEQWLTQAINK